MITSKMANSFIIADEDDLDPFANLDEGLDNINLENNVARDRDDRLTKMTESLVGCLKTSQPDDELLDTCRTMGHRIAGFSRPGVELTKRTLWSGLDAGSLEGHMQAEGLGQLFVRLLTSNFEESVAARAEKRPPAFTDE